MRTRHIVLALLALSGCSKAETPEQAATRLQSESAAAKAAIDEINVRYVRYMNGHHADSVALLHVENGVMMPPMTAPVEGRENIKSFITANPLPPGSTLSFQAVDVVANGPIAIERGSYTFTMPGQGTAPAAVTPGKYLAHWHKVGNEWKLAADIWSDNVPPPAASN